MPKELAAALIAVVGVLGSALISYIISARQAFVETQKLRTELQAAFGGRLYAKRLETYPQIYAHVSRLGKHLDRGTITRTAIHQCLEGFEEWDSEHAILFGAGTGKLAYRLRKTLREMLTKTDEEVETIFSSEESRKSFRHRLEEFELALKHELGTYHFESPTNLRDAEQFGSYPEAQRHLSERALTVDSSVSHQLPGRGHNNDDA
jgi:hypothetical protein